MSSRCHASDGSHQGPSLPRQNTQRFSKSKTRAQGALSEGSSKGSSLVIHRKQWTTTEILDCAIRWMIAPCHCIGGPDRFSQYIFHDVRSVITPHGQGR